MLSRLSTLKTCNIIHNSNLSRVFYVVHAPWKSQVFCLLDVQKNILESQYIIQSNAIYTKNSIKRDILVIWFFHCFHYREHIIRFFNPMKCVKGNALDGRDSLAKSSLINKWDLKISFNQSIDCSCQNAIHFLRWIVLLVHRSSDFATSKWSK